jgi:hypothetical protein
VGARLDAAVPLLAAAVLSIAIGPWVDKIVKNGIIVLFESKQNSQAPRLPARFKPKALAATGSWAAEQYMVLSEAIVSPILGLTLVPDLLKGYRLLVCLSYVVALVGLLATWRLIKRRSPSEYVVKCRAKTIPGVGKYLRKLPVIRNLSWGVLASFVTSLVAAGLAALVAQ